MIDGILIAAVIAGVFFVVRSRRVRGGACASCGEAESCTGRLTGEGHCHAADDMLSHVDAALKDRTSFE